MDEELIEVLSRWYILSTRMATPILPKGSCFVQRIDGRVEERSNLLLWYTCDGLNSGKSVMIHGTIVGPLYPKLSTCLRVPS